MAELVIDNDIGRVYGIEEKTKKNLRHVLSYKVKGYWFSDAYKQGRWDGTKSLFWRGSIFPVGLAGLVAEQLHKEGYEDITVRDRRAEPEHGPGLDFKGEVRDYQEVEEQCIHATRGIINFATGSGKTAVSARIIARIDVPTLYIVPTVELLHQTAEELHAFLGIPIGKLGDGFKEFDEYIVVATIQTLHAGLNGRSKSNHQVIHVLTEKQLLFVDEAHHLGADSFYKVVTASKAYYKFGLTGTAYRSDEAGIMLRAATGKVIAKITSSDLIQRGVLAKAHVKMYVTNTIKYLGTDYQEVYEKGIVKNDVRNRLIVSITNERVAQGKVVLILVKLLEHGRILERLVSGSVFVSGQDTSEKREEVMQGIRSKELKAVIATKIYDEGVDIPSIDVLIVAAGGTSKVKAIQRVGRALRKAEGKDETEIVDFVDVFQKTLLRHSRARRKMYDTEPEFDIQEIDVSGVYNDTELTEAEV